MATKKRTFAVIDFETDPFKHGRPPKPFAAGFYDGKVYLNFWGADCVDRILAYLLTRKDKLTIYAHNGGKFDFFYLLEKHALANPALIIHGRIVKCGLLNGQHELRDSYAAIPIPLSKYKKDDMDYSKMEADVRDEHREYIESYLKNDCLYLHELIQKFVDRFGFKLTIGATAMAQIESMHRVSRQNKQHDEIFRPYYFGGRVECFEHGMLPGTWKIYDVNSMYPKAMRDYHHPDGGNYVTLSGETVAPLFNHRDGSIRKFVKADSGVYFIRFIGRNNGALPMRPLVKTEGLNFNAEQGEFFACSHEVKVALKLGLLKIDQILEVMIPCNKMTFDKFVDTFSAEKIAAKLSGNLADEIFSKLILNSGYGKYGTDPQSFKDYFILDTWDTERLIEFEEWRKLNTYTDEETGEHTRPNLLEDLGQYEIWECPNPDEKGYFDVAVAASITSAARSILLMAIHHADRPIYCDTDSLICKSIRNVDIDDAKLGAWKFEGSGDICYIAGKKLYSMQLNELDKNGKVKFKSASKGAKLTHGDIVELCAGKSVKWNNDAPNFKLGGDVNFISRNISARY